jgi:hypothetical protein
MIWIKKRLPILTINWKIIINPELLRTALCYSKKSKELINVVGGINYYYPWDDSKELR